ncbi:MAG: UDP-N-acetylmuramoyl-L-alanine--D-glutamate ligase [Gammaproteobacteria bacterium]|nr:MAG: UDP-N-acetylmuramoyl-L-alanine--D-glutamate ligase [Gammaproteobacteria bacterium]
MNQASQHAEQAHSILIIGLGQTGLSCARFLVAQGFDVAIMDTRDDAPCLSLLQEEMPEVLVKMGGLDSQWMQQADMIVLSPGIDPRLPEIVAAKQAGVELIGDIELFARYADAPIVAITGSNGKSTVTTLLADMAVESGKVVKVGGNLGIPALALLTEEKPDFYIVELSSFQLETVKSMNAFVSTVLNISPDHLDRYDNEQAYQNAKATIYNGDGVMVLNSDDANVISLFQEGRNHIRFGLQQSDGVNFGLIEQEGEQYLAEGSQPLLAVSKLKIKGTHNSANALAALALGSAMGLEMSAMLSTLQTYIGLPHRCRLVASNDDIAWFNDSKATNVGACIAAIEGLADSGKIILIAGGVAKDQDFSPLTAILKSHVRDMIVFGQDAGLLADICPKTIALHRVDTLQQAVNKAFDLAVSGNNVLLSPACASFDMFSGYAQRGDEFERCVQELINE